MNNWEAIYHSTDIATARPPASKSDRETFMSRRVSYASANIGNVRQYQFLPEHEAQAIIKQKMRGLISASWGITLGWFVFISLAVWAILTVPVLICIAILILLLCTGRLAELINAPNNYPTTISLCDYGINFQRFVNDPDSTYVRRRDCLVSSSRSIWFSWGSVTQVNYLDSAYTILPDISFPFGGRVYCGPVIDLILDPEKMTADELWVYKSSAIPLWSNWPSPNISSEGSHRLLGLRIDLSSLTLESEKERFIHTIKKYIPAERLDSSILNLETNSDSYTKFWLDDFEKATKRKETSGLPKGHRLAKNRYKLLGTIASGGQATVYLAEPASSEDLPSHVVLKEFILPIDAGPEVTRRALAHVQEEAELLKALDNPYIVRFIESFVDDHRAYLVLEYVEGKTLRELIKENGPLSESMVIELALKMSEILSYLHSQTPPVIHRDFTPDNLMLAIPNQIKLIDFNVAQRLESSSTRTVVGKHCYIPPEQFRGKAMAQSDLYAFGGTLFYLLTGADPTPLTCSNPSTILPLINPNLAAIVTRATDLDPTRRYPDASFVKNDLEKLFVTKAP